MAEIWFRGVKDTTTLPVDEGHRLPVETQPADEYVQVGYEQQFTLLIDGGREQESVLRPQVIVLHVEPLQAFVRPISHNQFGRSVAIVEPMSMRRLELAVLGTFTADRLDELRQARAPAGRRPRRSSRTGRRGRAQRLRRRRKTESGWVAACGKLT